MNILIEILVVTFAFCILWIYTRRLALWMAIMPSKRIVMINKTFKSGFFSVFSASTSSDTEAEFIDDNTMINSKKIAKILRIFFSVIYVLAVIALIVN